MVKRANKKIQTLYVSMNGYYVGRLTKIYQGTLSFQYETEWLSFFESRPLSMSMPLRVEKYSGEVVENFFDNLLPENSQIRTQIQKRFGLQSSHTFDLLTAIGHDCIGALQFTKELPIFVKKIEYQVLTNKQMSHWLASVPVNPLGMQLENHDFRISLAGVQEKSALLNYKNKWCYPKGVTPTTHIFKLPIGVIHHSGLDLTDSCENEWLCLEIAKAFGLQAANASIECFGSSKALVVERFDRQYSSDKKVIMRLPQEDLCQAMGVSSELKYESDGGPDIPQIMRFLLGSACAEEDRKTFFQSQILFYLLAAIDGHAKNFSIFIKPFGQYCLTPLYDIISAHPLLKTKHLQSQKIKMAMALRGKQKHYHWHTIQKRHFLSTAKMANFSVKKSEELISDMLGQVDNVIAHVSQLLPKEFPNEIVEPIFSGMINAKNRLIK